MNATAKYHRLAQLIRGYAVKMTNCRSSGHVGSSLSMADIVAVLYGRILRVDPANPRWPDRDRFILSKGHAAAGVYGALAEKGFFPKEWIDTYYGDDGKLCGHISHHVPGVEFSTGSLGHGLPVAAGMALVAKRLKRTHRIFCLMSDGDCNEGSTWEAIMFAAQHGFDNLTAIVDANRIQALGKVEDIIDMEPFARKVEAFGWAVREIDGHDLEQIEKMLLAVPFQKGKPSFIIARTVKGKGVKFIENTVSSHYRCIPDEKLKEVYAELGVSDAFPV
jgi:transketolase